MSTDWRIVNDDVMGGVSSARVEPSTTGVRFSGEVRLEFNGGFASMRRAASLPASATGLQVQARGDGNRYRLTVYTRDAASGRAVPDAPPITAAEVLGLGIMITKAEHAAGAGAFALELIDIAPVLADT